MERRLAAVMIADVAGYGSLSRADEEGTRARFQSDLHEIFEPKIATHVHAVPERAALEIAFPRVEGFRVDLPSENLTASFDATLFSARATRTGSVSVIDLNLSSHRGPLRDAVGSGCAAGGRLAYSFKASIGTPTSSM